MSPLSGPWGSIRSVCLSSKNLSEHLIEISLLHFPRGALPFVGRAPLRPTLRSGFADGARSEVF